MAETSFDVLRSLIRDVPDHPEPGIVFKDITPLLADAAGLSSMIAAMAAPWRDTEIDLVLGLDEPLDLVIVIPPMAQPRRRKGAAIYEPLIDRVGAQALRDELGVITDRWPGTKFLVIRPPGVCLEEMRPNPMDPSAAVPTFTTTLEVMKTELARPEVWRLLSYHLMVEPSST